MDETKDESKKGIVLNGRHVTVLSPAPRFNERRRNVCQEMRGDGHGLRYLIQDGHLFKPGGDHEYVGEYFTGTTLGENELPPKHPGYTEEELNALKWRQLNQLVIEHGGEPAVGPVGRSKNIQWLLDHV